MTPSHFPRVRVEHHATVIVAYRRAPAAGRVTRWERVHGNLVHMVAPGRSAANDLGYLIQGSSIGQHLSVTVNDLEQAHGAESSILDPFSGLV